MKKIALSVIILLCSFTTTAQNANFNFGTAYNFILFSGAGAVANTGTSTITGDVGANVGAISGFGAPTTLNGTVENANSITAQAIIDLNVACVQIQNTAVTIIPDHSTTFGAVAGETIYHGVYSTGAAASIIGTLTLDAQGDTSAVFIFKIGGALSSVAGSEIVLINGASSDNVFWIAVGAVGLGANSTAVGTFIGYPGAVALGAGGSLTGRLYATVGAIAINSGTLATTPPIVNGSLSGNVFEDADGDADVDGLAIYNPEGSQLYATLLDNGGAVVATTPIANNGSYSFSALSPANYSVVISTSQNATSPAIPANWIHSGENVGTIGNDGIANGIVAATVAAAANTSDVNFGIMQLATGISGNVLNDANGLTDNTVNGIGINTATASPLFINVLDGVNNVVANAAVNGDGSYAITGLNSGNYTVSLSTNAGGIGLPATPLGLPAGWVSTGENQGATPGNDGLIDSRIATTVTLGNISSQVNFGIEELPLAGNSNAAPQANPGGVIVIPVVPALFVSSDNNGNVSSITISAFPLNTNTLEVNGFGYTVGTFPFGGISIPTDVNGTPLQAVNVDPIDGNISVVIPFTVKDNAGFESASPGSITLPFTTPFVDIVNNYPALGFNSFACEDLWPYPGDYDLNDLVIDYQFKITTSSTMILKEVEITFVVKAVGAEFKNGFGFQFNTDAINPADILSATGSVLSENYINLAGNGLEAGQSKPTFILYDNSFNIMPFPGGVGVGINTNPLNPTVAPVTLIATITFDPADGYSLFDLNVENFNPFLMSDQTRGREVHLPYYEPTDLADQSMLGSASDTYNAGSGRSYVNNQNHPWALNISGSYDWPTEQTNIMEAYTKFKTWAESGGVLFPDWYADLSGFRVASNIYISNGGSNGRQSKQSTESTTQQLRGK